MLALEETCLVPPHGPIKPVCRAPPLFWRHPSQHFDLFRAGLLVRPHNETLPAKEYLGKPAVLASLSYWLEPLRKVAAFFKNLLRSCGTGQGLSATI